MNQFERDFRFKNYFRIVRDNGFKLRFPIFSKLEPWFLYENNLYKNPNLIIDGKTIGIVDDDGIITSELTMDLQSLDLFDFVNVTPSELWIDFNIYNGKLLVR